MDESGWTRRRLFFPEMARIILAQLPHRTIELGRKTAVFRLIVKADAPK